MVCCAVCDAGAFLNMTGHYLTFFLSTLNEVFVSGEAHPNIKITTQLLAVGDWNLFILTGTFSPLLMNKMLCSLANSGLGRMLVILGPVDLWWPFGAGTLKHKVWISLRISPVECSTRWTWWKTHSSFSMSLPRLFPSSSTELLFTHLIRSHPFLLPFSSPRLMHTHLQTFRLSVSVECWHSSAHWGNVFWGEAC